LNNSGFFFCHSLLWQRGRLAEARLDAETALRGQTLAELRALQAQVEPHFLFNTLAHLDALLQNDTLDEAQDLLDYFTRYLRGTLSTTPYNLIITAR
jgi:sensor histidine kinase YesM